MSARRWLALGAGLLITVTVALVVGVVALLMFANWGDPELSEKYVATALVLAFTAIATGGAGSFMVVPVIE